MTNQSERLVGPIEGLFEAIPVRGEVDYGDERVTRAVTEVLAKLVYCQDTMAILVNRLGLTPSDYAVARRTFEPLTDAED